MPALNPPEEASGEAASAESTVDRAPSVVLCRECGYDLRGLPTEGRCPECGTSVRLSLISLRLTDAAPTWLRSIARGMLAIKVGIVAPLFVIPMAIGGLLECVPLLLGSALRCYGVWLATMPDPRYSLTGQPRAAPQTFRLLAFADVLTHLALTWQSWPGGSGTAPLILMMVTGASMVTNAFCLRKVCRRLFGSLVRRTSAFVAWWLLVMFVLFVLSVGLAELGGLGHATRDVLACVAGGSGALFVGSAPLLLFDIRWLRKELKVAIRSRGQQRR